MEKKKITGIFIPQNINKDSSNKAIKDSTIQVSTNYKDNLQPIFKLDPKETVLQTNEKIAKLKSSIDFLNKISENLSEFNNRMNSNLFLNNFAEKFYFKETVVHKNLEKGGTVNFSVETFNPKVEIKEKELYEEIRNVKTVDEETFLSEVQKSKRAKQEIARSKKAASISPADYIFIHENIFNIKNKVNDIKLFSNTKRNLKVKNGRKLNLTIGKVKISKRKDRKIEKEVMQEILYSSSSAKTKTKIVKNKTKIVKNKRKAIDNKRKAIESSSSDSFIISSEEVN